MGYRKDQSVFDFKMFFSFQNKTSTQDNTKRFSALYDQWFWIAWGFLLLLSPGKLFLLFVL